VLPEEELPEVVLFDEELPLTLELPELVLPEVVLFEELLELPL
jgi:hypothetical protein